MSRKGRHLFTSESVTEGHPDKIADQISDAILDAILSEDPRARVACETMVTTGLACVAGEITTDTYVHFPEIVRRTIDEIGYNDATYGFDSKTCAVISTIDKQSPDIAMGVDTVVVSTQHADSVAQDKIRKTVIAEIIEPALPEELFDKKNTTYHINPT